jgi:sterol 3beta-glucosyltransferase
LSAEKLISAIQRVQTVEIKNNVSTVGQHIRNENGLDNAITEIEKYFNDK